MNSYIECTWCEYPIVVSQWIIHDATCVTTLQNQQHKLFQLTLICSLYRLLLHFVDLYYMSILKLSKCLGVDLLLYGVTNGFHWYEYKITYFNNCWSVLCIIIIYWLLVEWLFNCIFTVHYWLKLLIHSASNCSITLILL